MKTTFSYLANRLFALSRFVTLRHQLQSKEIIAIVSSCFLITGIGSVAACKPKDLDMDTYYFQIKNIHLKIPAKYLHLACAGIGAPDIRSCNELLKTKANKEPGLPLPGLTFFEQNIRDFERYQESDGFKGLSNSLRIDLNDPDAIPKGRHLPSATATWAAEDRNPADDVYGLKAYVNRVHKEEKAYRFEIEGGGVLLMACTAFNMPNPGCHVATYWRGLLLRYDFRLRHLGEWQDLHKRIVSHLDSFIK